MRAARAHGVLSLVDGAQTFGALDVNLSDIDPDFYTGSAHKWPCGPLEAGVLYVNAARPVAPLAKRHQPLRGADRHLEDLRRARPAGRAGDPRLW